MTQWGTPTRPIWEIWCHVGWQGVGVTQHWKIRWSDRYTWCHVMVLSYSAECFMQCACLFSVQLKDFTQDALSSVRLEQPKATRKARPKREKSLSPEPGTSKVWDSCKQRVVLLVAIWHFDLPERTDETQSCSSELPVEETQKLTAQKDCCERVKKRSALCQAIFAEWNSSVLIRVQVGRFIVRPVAQTRRMKDGSEEPGTDTHVRTPQASCRPRQINCTQNSQCPSDSAMNAWKCRLQLNLICAEQNLPSWSQTLATGSWPQVWSWTRP